MITLQDDRIGGILGRRCRSQDTGTEKKKDRQYEIDKEQPGERSIYIWNICGSIVNALFSVVALMIVTRFLDDREADIFSIAWTISQLMATVGTFQIRVYQATDVQGTFLFQHYLIFRIVTVAAMISSAAYIVVRGYTGEKALVVLVVCLFRAVDSLADVYEGWFQQKERLDLSRKSADLPGDPCGGRICMWIDLDEKSAVFLCDPFWRLSALFCYLRSPVSYGSRTVSGCAGRA